MKNPAGLGRWPPTIEFGSEVSGMSGMGSFFLATVAKGLAHEGNVGSLSIN